MGPDVHPRSRLPEKALNALYRSGIEARPWVTYIFLAVCLLVTLPTLVFPGLYQIFGGIEPRHYWWQPATAAFEHGWPGIHGSIHLALNAFLILEAGRPCERLLGSGRFLLLGLLSLFANAFVVSLTEGVNGSSLVIWSWGPPLFVALMWARRQEGDVSQSGEYGRLVSVLVLMYGLITLVMGFLPYAYGWRGNLIVGFLLGNLYHLVATVVGIVFAWFSRGYIRRRMMRLQHG